MIGTFERLRSSRHTSMPLIRGQHDVEQHEVGFDRVEELEGGGTVAGHLHPEALAPEADGERLDEGLLVLHHQHGSLGHGAVSYPASWVTTTGPGPAGMTSVNVEPSPSRESTSTSPPWFEATWRTMARPSPVPPVSRLRARSTR